MQGNLRRKIVAEALLKRRIKTMMRYDDRNYVDSSPVTQAEYQLFLDEMRDSGEYFQPDHWEGYQYLPGSGLEPAVGIRASDAVRFCGWLTEREGGYWRFRIPTFSDDTKFISYPKILKNFWVGETGIYCLSNSENKGIRAFAMELASIHKNNATNSIFKSIVKTHINSYASDAREIVEIDSVTDLELELNDYDLDLAIDLDIDIGLDLGLNYALDYAFNRNRDHVIAFVKKMDAEIELSDFSALSVDLNTIKNLASEFNLAFHPDIAIELATTLEKDTGNVTGKSNNLSNSYREAKIKLIVESQKVITQTMVSYLEVFFKETVSIIDTKDQHVKQIIETRLQTLLYIFIRLAKMLGKITDNIAVTETILLVRQLIY